MRGRSVLRCPSVGVELEVERPQRVRHDRAHRPDMSADPSQALLAALLWDAKTLGTPQPSDPLVVHRPAGPTSSLGCSSPGLGSRMARGTWRIVRIPLGAWTYRNDRLRSQRNQASLVHALPIGGYRFSRGNSSSDVKVKIVNGSSTPVYDVKIGLLPWEWADQRSDLPAGKESLCGRLVAVLTAETETDEVPLDATDLPAPLSGI